MDSSKGNGYPVDENETGASNERLIELEKKIKEKEDLYLRALADLDNFRKRIDRESKEIEKKIRKAILLEFLKVADSLEMAVDHEGNDIISLREGVRAIYRQLMDILKRNGVVRLDALGSDFDPHYHEAVGSIESDNRPSGKVGQELQKGYLLENELLRPARVLVAK